MNIINERQKCALLTVLIITLTLSVFTCTAKDQSKGKAIKPIEEAYRLILEEYYKPESIDREELIREAISGMLDHLPDKHNSVFTKKGYRDYRESQEGTYVGVGMEIARKDDQIIVLATFPGTPAAKSILGPQYVIESVEGKPTSEMTFEEVSSSIKGEKGTTVRLRVKSPEGKEKSITLTRQKVNIPLVEFDYLSKEKIGLIDINRFNAGAAEELKRALKKSEKLDVQGFILDLRDNPGGSLNSAVEVGSYFVDEGLITTLVSPDKKDKKFKTKGNSIPNLPLVVMINDSSASASELVAGALRDHGMAVLVGRNSYGKGLVQTTHTVNDGFKIKLSTAEYITPAGHKVQGKGLSPDIKSSKRGDDMDLAISWINSHRGQKMPLSQTNGDKPKETSTEPGYN